MRAAINGALLHNFGRNSSLTVDSMGHARRVLARAGVVAIRNFYDRRKALRLGEILLDVAATARDQLGDSPFYETEEYAAQADLARFRSYHDIANAGKPVLNIRSRNNDAPDGGFVDFFGIEKLMSPNPEFVDCFERLRCPSVKNVLEGVNAGPGRQMNLYINQGITNTRGPHVDNLDNSYKCFLYLTDVPSDEYGPYSYLPESQRIKPLTRANIHINKRVGVRATDMPVPGSSMVRFLGDAGTLIISNQSGVHGGIPQAPDKTRVILVDNYF